MIRQTPYTEIFSLFDSLNQSMFPVRVSRSESSTRRVNSRLGMPLDCYTTDDHAVVLASVPGMHPDDIQVSVNEDMLTVSGRVMSDRKQQDEQGKQVTWYMSEIPRGSFERSIRLPFPVEEEQVEAQFSHGMLRIVLPKQEAAMPRRVAVQVLDTKLPEIEDTASEESSYSAD